MHARSTALYTCKEKDLLFYFFLFFTVKCVKPPIHDATCNMQFAACNRIASCVLKMLRVPCSVKLFHANRIVVYSLQHVARSFKGFTGNAATEHLSRRGDYSEMQRFYDLASVGTKMAAFSWTVAKIDVLQVRRRRSYRYGEQRTIFIPVRRRPTTSLRPATPARHACPSIPCPCSTIRIIIGERAKRVSLSLIM